ncbi:uncharacterized protein [Pseudochaenichthys georgianus]|uniref:uncharacterized protein isoform X2 n=1 Tax=Pseudochaenichthys georgianus TaxID=52239 RepID=UPI00146F8D8E|nr:uncharacterized protein LOC117451084 isoform X2 [Pseudochaenichthys georgianus]
MAFVLEQFVASPTVGQLDGCRKVDLRLVADHYHVSVSSALVKSELKATLITGLVEQGVLRRPVLVESPGTVVQSATKQANIFTTPQFDSFSAGSSPTGSKVDARVKVRMARLQCEREEREREREFQLRRELESRKHELEIRKLEADTAVRMRQLELQAAVVDASGSGAGAVLLQEGDGGVSHPVCYFSTKFKRHQLNYSTIEKETLAMLLALQHFQVYVGSSSTPVVVYTDHNPLVFLSQMLNHNQRLMRWALLAQDFNIVINYKKGADNVVADVLSRRCSLFPGAASSQVLLLCNQGFHIGTEEDGSEGPSFSPSRLAACVQPVSVYNPA